MGYGIAPSFSHFTGKKKGRDKPHKKKVKVKRVHKNKYSISDKHYQKKNSSIQN